MLPDSCLTLRNGAQATVVASEIVPGDVLYIKAGNKLPADVRFVEISSDAKFDRSILTGEDYLRIFLLLLCVDADELVDRRVVTTCWDC